MIPSVVIGPLGVLDVVAIAAAGIVLAAIGPEMVATVRGGWTRKATTPFRGRRLDDPALGPLVQVGPRAWEGERAMGGEEPTMILLDAGDSGPSAAQHRRFEAWLAQREALASRVGRVLDPEGRDLSGDWWLAAVDLRDAAEGENVIELTYEHRRTGALRSIELRGDPVDPEIVDISAVIPAVDP